MSQETHQEDQTLLATVDSLEPGRSPFEPLPPGTRDETAETLARLYKEVLGLIPYELDPAAPRPEVKQRLMTAIAGEETQEVAELRAAPIAPPAPIPAPAAPPAPAPTPVQPSREMRTMGSQEARVPSRRPMAAVASRRASRWPLALAASLALVFAGLSGWLYLEQARQREEIAQLRSEIQEAEQAATEIGRMRDELAEMRDTLTLVTSPAVLVSPMRPMGEPPIQPGARGTLFVAADHQHWYLRLEGLQPAGEGKTYHLWWVADQGILSGGTFTARPGERIELSSATMPANTRAAMVTMEDEGSSPDAPTGPEVMRSGDVYEVL